MWTRKGFTDIIALLLSNQDFYPEMKFKASQIDFSKALLVSSKSLLLKANLPILSSILITASKNKVEIVSTNLETATKAVFNCEVEIEGKAAVSGRTLLEFVSQIPEGEIVFEKLGEEAVLTTKGYKARFATMAAEEFPAIPKIEKGIELRVGALDFSEAVNRVAFCAAQDEGRPVLTGILMEVAKGKASMVATDGYRLGYGEITILKEGELNNFKIILPARAAIEVAKIVLESGNLVEGEEKGQELVVVVAESLNQIVFKISNVEFTSRLIEGEFPNWQKIIPSEFITKARVAKAEFIRLIKVASIFAREAGSIVKLNFVPGASGKGGALNVSANTSQVGSTDLECEAEISGKGGEIAFNFRYLLEVVGVIADEDVYFEMIESLNPGKITPTEEKEKFFHIIMPVRLQA